MSFCSLSHIAQSAHSGCISAKVLLYVCILVQLSTLLRPLHLLATKLVWSKVREALGVR